METFIFLLFAGVALLFVALGIPLFIRVVPPNPLYGFRTPRTISDAAIWYPVNRVTGAWMIMAGVLVGLAAIGAYRAGLDGAVAAFINIAALIVGAAAMCVHGFIVLRRLTRAQPFRINAIQRTKLASKSGPRECAKKGCHPYATSTNRSPGEALPPSPHLL